MKKIDKKELIKLLAIITIINIMIVLIVLIAVPQDQALHSIISSILVFSWGFDILFVGIPKLREEIMSYIEYIHPILIALIIAIFPYILLLLGGATTLNSILIWSIWYMLPALLFTVPKLLSDLKIQITANTVAAFILWIGFDHRYTSVLFDGWKDMSYILNAFWMAHVGITLFGIYTGISIPENSNDKALVPSKYGLKIVNIATPLASLIIVPFGLLTGFLLWNPQEFDLFNIIISFVGIYLTIALQEELIFRGILLNQTIRHTKSDRGYYVLYVLISLAFALTHWNNETPQFVYHYFFAAFIAGLAYGYSYKKGGMFAAMLSHTMVDWVWALLLQRV